MRVTVRASTGVEISVWKEGSLFLARRAGSRAEPQMCIALDLFEVIAEIAGLKLESVEESREALTLAKSALAELGKT